jgi:hypothetical protein
VESTSLEANFGIKNLFIPPGTDGIKFLSKKYQKILDFTVPRSDEPE